jgi:hypothetical protein
MNPFAASPPPFKLGQQGQLALGDEDLRQSAAIEIFEQHLPQIPKDYVFKPRERKFVEDTFQVAFDMLGGVPRRTKWAHENLAEVIKLWARMLPEAQKHEEGAAVVYVFRNVPQSLLDVGDIVDIDDLDDE